MVNYALNRSLIATILLGFSIVAAAQGRSDLDELGYFGPVKSTRLESVSISWETGRQKLSARRLEATESFDLNGHLLEQADFDEAGKCSYIENNSFSRGHLVETKVDYVVDQDGPNVRVFEYDSRGNLIEEREYEPDGEPFDRELYEYDSRDLLVRKTRYSYIRPEQPDIYLSTYAYDQRGRMTESRNFVGKDGEFEPTDDYSGPHRRVLAYANTRYWIRSQTFNAQGELVTTSTLARDGQGNELEDIEYDAQQRIKDRVRYEYTFDRRGNWIEQRTYRWDSSARQFRLQDIDFRAVEYFEK